MKVTQWARPNNKPCTCGDTFYGMKDLHCIKCGGEFNKILVSPGMLEERASSLDKAIDEEDQHQTDNDEKLEQIMNKKIVFKYEYIEKMEEVRIWIQLCEGMHVQQVAYSTFHDALTQICFGCKKIRSSLKI